MLQHTKIHYIYNQSSKTLHIWFACFLSGEEIGFWRAASGLCPKQQHQDFYWTDRVQLIFKIQYNRSCWYNVKVKLVMRSIWTNIFQLLIHIGTTHWKQFCREIQMSFLFYMHLLINRIEHCSDFLKPIVMIPWFQSWSGEHWTNPHFTNCHPLRWSKTKVHIMIPVILFYIKYLNIKFSMEYNLDWLNSMFWTLNSQKAFWECA